LDVIIVITKIIKLKLKWWSVKFDVGRRIRGKETKTRKKKKKKKKK
jgi:hypothetical protein